MILHLNRRLFNNEIYFLVFDPICPKPFDGIKALARREGEFLA